MIDKDMWETLSYLPNDDTIQLPMGEWFYELSWELSQRYFYIEHNGVDYVLYLRWRRRDPWQAYVIRNATSLADMNKDPAIWSGDVFEMYHIHYRAEELELAKEKIIRLFYEFNGQFTELRTIIQNVE